jgi:hypothetical protein
MRAPEAHLALVMALLPSAVLFGMAYWRFKVLRRYTHLTVIAFAFGSALAALVITVSATYAFRPFSAAQASIWLAAAPVLVYVGVLAVVSKASKLSSPGFVIGGSVAVLPLYFFCFYAWLLAACSFGNCL